MKSQWFRYAVVAAFACVLGALAHACISRAIRTPGPDQSAEKSAPNQDLAGTKDLENALLQKLWDVIDAVDDLSSNEKSEARAILEEADPVLARIKRDNQRAIEILRNPLRRVTPTRPAPPATSEPSQPAAESSSQAEDGGS